MVNPQDVSLFVQAAIKNAAAGKVFYFKIPVPMEVVFKQTPAMDVQALASAWKGFDEHEFEVSAIVNGLFTLSLKCAEMLVLIMRSVGSFFSRFLCIVFRL
jgi:hypothetical protein